MADEILTIAGADLQAKYTKFEKVFKTLAAYPSNEGRHSQSLKDEVLVSRVKECMMTLATTMIDHPLTIRTSPSRLVISNSEIEAGKLRLSPVTSSVSLYDEKKRKGIIDPRNTLTLTLPGADQQMLFSMGTPLVDENFCSTYFVVGVTHDEHRGNMVLQTENVPFILASCSKLRLSGHEHSVSIPILVNKSIIKKGEELLHFVKKAAVDKKPAEVRAMEFKPSTAKRIKVASS